MTMLAKITKLSNSSSFDNFSHISQIRIPNNCTNIPENWLILTILGLARYRIDLDNFKGCIADELNQRLKIIDRNGNRLTIRQFVSDYESANYPW